VGGAPRPALDGLALFPNLLSVRWGIRFGLLVVVLGLVLPGTAMGFVPLSSFGTFGSGAGQLGSPRGVTVGPRGTVYVTEVENHRISVFDAAGRFDFAIGEGVRPDGGDTCTATSGCKAGLQFASNEALSNPIGAALGPEGRLFISDNIENGRVTVYNSVGTFQYGFGVGRLHEPGGIEFDRSGLLHVANSGENRIDVFTPGGTFVRGIGKDVGPGGADVCTESSGCQAGPPDDGSAGAMDRPRDVAFGPAGELIVSDIGNVRIDVFAADGPFLRAFGKQVNSGGGDEDVCTTECQEGTSGAELGAFDGLAGVAADAAGWVYVVDHVNSRVNVSRLDGSSPSAFDVASEPFGVALDCRGAVYVTEASAGFARVERFGEPGTAPAPCVSATATPAPIDGPAAAKPPSNRFRFAGLVRNRRNGSAVLFVRVPGRGRLFLKGRGVRRLARGALMATRVRLPVKPKVRLRRWLKKHGRGRIRVEVTFAPVGGEPRTLEKRIVLKRRRG
jgi:NHL repeat